MHFAWRLFDILSNLPFFVEILVFQQKDPIFSNFRRFRRRTRVQEGLPFFPAPPPYATQIYIEPFILLSHRLLAFKLYNALHCADDGISIVHTRLGNKGRKPSLPLWRTYRASDWF